MPLIKYTTDVSVKKTTNEITNILMENGATGIYYDIQRGDIQGISFQIDTERGNIPINMPIEITKAKEMLRRQYSQGIAPRSVLKEGQAEKVAWRIAKGWLEMMMAMVQLGMVKLDQVFMPYIQLESGATMYDRWLETGSKLALPDEEAGDPS